MSDFDSKQNEYKEKLIEKYSEARIVRKIVLIIFIVALLVISGVVGGGYLYIKSALKPVDPESKKKVEVTIPIGSSPRAIANILEDEGIVKNAKVFRYYTKFKNESGFQAGDYTLSPSMTFTDIIKSLKTGRVLEDVVFQLTIPEGKQLTEIAKLISEKTGHSKEKIMEKLQDKAYIEQLMVKHPDLLTSEILHEDIKYALEGYLFPATYPFYEEKPSIEKIIETMIKHTEKIVFKYRAELDAGGMTPHQLLTMSSLIEEEATAKTDREKIASVFYNRMEIDMPLQTDPTVLYALGEHKDRVLFEHLKVDSPYNTYKINGLPPGPIANSGEMSISATLNPAETSFYYFLATKTGEVLYSETLEEHNRKIAQYLSN